MRKRVTDWSVYKYKGKQVFHEKEFIESTGNYKEAFVDLVFMNKLFKARMLADVPFLITSGNRSVKFNEQKKGSPNSDHLFGNIRDKKGEMQMRYTCGVDIKTQNDRHRFKIIKACMDAGLNRFGTYPNQPNIIHVGLNVYNDADVFWNRVG